MQQSFPAQQPSRSVTNASDQRLGPLDWISLVLAIIGALNWGLVGLFRFNLVAAIFGEMSPVSRIVYVIVGLAGLYMIFLATRLRHHRTATA